MNQVQPPYNSSPAGNAGQRYQPNTGANGNNGYVAGQQPRSTERNNIGFLTGQRDQKAFSKAHKHTAQVRLLRILFPIVAVFMMLGIGGSYFWYSLGAPTIQVQSTSFDDGNMVMKNPVLKGVDKANRPYELTAVEAIQNAKKLMQIELNQISANIPMDEKTYAKITAGNGFYDSEAKTLVLGGEVDIITDNGMRIRLQDADIDIGAGNMFTNNPVIMNSAQAKIKADSVAIEDNGESIIFNKNVKMTLFPNKIKATQNTPNANIAN